MQIRLGVSTPGHEDAFNEAEALIGRVLTRDDPVEGGHDPARNRTRSSITPTVAERMAEAGFGAPLATTAAEVMNRLKSAQVSPQS